MELQQERLIAIAGTGAVMVAGATLTVVGLAVPWAVSTDSYEYHSSAEIGWAMFTEGAAEVVVAIVLLMTVGVAVAAAISQSAAANRAAQTLGIVVAVATAALLVFGLANTDVNRPAVGLYTTLIGLVAVAVAATVRRRQLSS